MKASFCSMLSVALIVLKLCGVIACSWALVLLPVGCLLLAGVLGALLVRWLVKKWYPCGKASITFDVTL